LHSLLKQAAQPNEKNMDNQVQPLNPEAFNQENAEPEAVVAIQATQDSTESAGLAGQSENCVDEELRTCAEGVELNTHFVEGLKGSRVNNEDHDINQLKQIELDPPLYTQELKAISENVAKTTETNEHMETRSQVEIVSGNNLEIAEHGKHKEQNQAQSLEQDQDQVQECDEEQEEREQEQVQEKDQTQVQNQNQNQNQNQEQEPAQLKEHAQLQEQDQTQDQVQEHPKVQQVADVELTQDIDGDVSAHIDAQPTQEQQQHQGSMVDTAAFIESMTADSMVNSEVELPIASTAQRILEVKQDLQTVTHHNDWDFIGSLMMLLEFVAQNASMTFKTLPYLVVGLTFIPTLSDWMFIIIGVILGVLIMLLLNRSEYPNSYKDLHDFCCSWQKNWYTVYKWYKTFEIFFLRFLHTNCCNSKNGYIQRKVLTAIACKESAEKQIKSLSKKTCPNSDVNLTAVEKLVDLLFDNVLFKDLHVLSFLCKPGMHKYVIPVVKTQLHILLMPIVMGAFVPVPAPATEASVLSMICSSLMPIIFCIPIWKIPLCLSHANEHHEHKQRLDESSLPEVEQTHVSGEKVTTKMMGNVQKICLIAIITEIVLCSIAFWWDGATDFGLAIDEAIYLYSFLVSMVAQYLNEFSMLFPHQMYRTLPWLGGAMMKRFFMLCTLWWTGVAFVSYYHTRSGYGCDVALKNALFVCVPITIIGFASNPDEVQPLVLACMKKFFPDILQNIFNFTVKWMRKIRTAFRCKNRSNSAHNSNVSSFRDNLPIIGQSLLKNIVVVNGFLAANDLARRMVTKMDEEVTITRALDQESQAVACLIRFMWFFVLAIVVLRVKSAFTTFHGFSPLHGAKLDSLNNMLDFLTGGGIVEVRTRNLDGTARCAEIDNEGCINFADETNDDVPVVEVGHERREFNILAQFNRMMKTAVKESIQVLNCLKQVMTTLKQNSMTPRDILMHAVEVSKQCQESLHNVQLELDNFKEQQESITRSNQHHWSQFTCLLNVPIKFRDASAVNNIKIPSVAINAEQHVKVHGFRPFANIYIKKTRIQRFWVGQNVKIEKKGETYGLPGCIDKIITGVNKDCPEKWTYHVSFRKVGDFERSRCECFYNEIRPLKLADSYRPRSGQYKPTLLREKLSANCTDQTRRQVRTLHSRLHSFLNQWDNGVRQGNDGVLGAISGLCNLVDEFNLLVKAELEISALVPSGPAPTFDEAPFTVASWVVQYSVISRVILVEELLEFGYKILKVVTSRFTDTVAMRAQVISIVTPTINGLKAALNVYYQHKAGAKKKKEKKKKSKMC
jgi:mRNA-degrading endonuclease YafQ of YafQ-DinJ toxin-antitoxin module